MSTLPPSCPPASNVTKYFEQGADLVIFSGGKQLRGPQSSGLILGSKRLIEACDANCCPNHSIGRPMKISKETIAGIVKAVELFVAKDEEQEMKRWEEMVAVMLSAFSSISDTVVRRGFPVSPGIQPVAIPRLFLKSGRLSAKQLKDRLMQHEPAIYVDVHGDEAVINPQCLEDDEIPVVIQAVFGLLQ